MEKNDLNLMKFQNGRIHGGFVLRSPGAPEQGNMALHVCRSGQDAMNARRLLAAQTLPLERWTLAQQKHTGQAVRVKSSDAGAGALDAQEALGPCDALYTTEPSQLIGVFTADCLGILLYDPSLPMAAAVHSGWKGTAQAILHRTLLELQLEGLLYPDRLQVRFSPSLLLCSLEVGPEVVQAVRAMAERLSLDLGGCIVPGQGDRSFIDNQEINIRMLRQFGVPEENIIRSSMDTKTRPDCFSYRRDGLRGGEHFSWIYIDADGQSGH